MKQSILSHFYLKIWAWVYALTLLCYSPFMFNFIWGNHDWQWVKEYTPLWSGVFEGRFSQFFVPIFLFSGVILPVFTVMSGLALFSVAAIEILRLWGLECRKIYYILIGLMITTSPYTLSWFYFAFIFLSCLLWALVIVLAFTLLQNERLSKCLKISTVTLLFTLALGGYPPIINMMGVLFFTFVIYDLCFKACSPKDLIIKYTPHGIAILFSVGLLLGIQHYLRIKGLQYDTYNTAGIDISMIWQKLQTCFKMSLVQFYVPINFFEKSFRTVILLIVLAALYILFIRVPKRWDYVLFLLLAIVGLLFSSEATLFAAKNEIYVLNEPRIMFYSLPYIYAFSAVILFKFGSQKIKNIAFVLLCWIFLYNFCTACFCAKIWVAGFDAENYFSERFLKRLEEKENFFPHTRRYNFIQGGTLNFRQRYYQQRPNEIIDPYTLSAPYVPWHLPSKAYMFYYPDKFVAGDSDVYWEYIDSSVASAQTARDYIAIQAEPWPSQTAIYADLYHIILTLTPQGRDMGRNWLRYRR